MGLYQWEHKLTHFPLGQMTVNWGNFCLQTSSSLSMEKRSVRVKIGCSFLSSHGQHLVLLLNGMRNMIKVNEMSTPASYLLHHPCLEVFWLFCPWLKPLFAYLKFAFIFWREDKLALSYSATKDNVQKKWKGSATIPLDYFPPGVVKLNAYAIHGTGRDRRYEALYPATKEFDRPDL